MTEYSVEEVREWIAIADAQAKLYAPMKGAHEPWEKLSKMLTAYAALLEQIERAREGVTDAMVDSVGSALFIYWNDVTKDVRKTYEGKVRSAIKSVAHLLPSGERGGADGADVFAYGAPDGRVIPKETRDVALRDGGASKSATDIYTIPLYTHPPAQVAQGEAKCPECNGDGYNWLVGAPAHHDNQLKCDRCGGTGVIHLIAVPELVVQGEAVYDLAMHLACEHGETDESGTGYCFSMEQLDAFIQAFVADQPRAVPDAWPKLELWFFRELVEAQRLKLFALHGMPVDEIGASHIHQKRALRQLLAAAPSPGEQSCR